MRKTLSRLRGSLRRSLRPGGTGICRIISLIRARIVSAARAHLVALVVGHFKADSVIPPIQHVIRWLISDRILVTQFVADVLERLVEIVHVIREERAAT